MEISIRLPCLTAQKWRPPGLRLAQWGVPVSLPTGVKPGWWSIPAAAGRRLHASTCLPRTSPCNFPGRSYVDVFISNYGSCGGGGPRRERSSLCSLPYSRRGPPPLQRHTSRPVEIGRASCREREEHSVVEG